MIKILLAVVFACLLACTNSASVNEKPALDNTDNDDTASRKFVDTAPGSVHPVDSANNN